MSADRRLLDEDARARQAALDIRRSFVVQAPAGSGKTELLIQRYLSLLAVVREPEEVLAITFTHKAALEMQTRVTAALHDAAHGVEAQSAHQRHTLQLAAAALARDAERGWQLGQSPRRMRIQTMDAFCARVVGSLPVSAGLGGAATLESEVEMQALYRRAAAATLDWLVTRTDAAAAVECVLTHLDNHTGDYVAYLARMLEKRDHWLELVGRGSLDAADAAAARRLLEANIAGYVEAQLRRLDGMLERNLRERLPALLRHAADRLARGADPQHPLRHLGRRIGLPGVTADQLPAWQGIAELLLTAAGEWRKAVDRNDGFLPEDREQKQALLELLAGLGDRDELRRQLGRVRMLPAPRYSDEQWQVLLALFGLLPLAVAELRRLFGELNVTDHTEVALAAAAALGSVDAPGDVALLLDYGVQHILVDEMQDTSAGQYQLIRTLVGGWTPGDGRTLFCVGDPMQSIYRFRDADVGRFLEIREQGIGSVMPEALVLRRNFRSGETLVDWFNAVFSRCMPARDDPGEGAISYSASVAVETNLASGVCRVHPLFGVSPDEEAECGVGVIRECLADASGDSTAVLVRSRTQLPPLLSALRHAGIACRAVEIDRLIDVPEIIDLHALTRALSHDGDRLAWLALLRSPLVGLGWSDLHALVVGLPTHTVPELLESPERLGALSADAQARLGHLRAVQASHFGRRGTETLRDRVELAWFALGGPAVLAGPEPLENVYRYLDLLSRAEIAGTPGELGDFERRLDDERVSSISTDPAAIQIMTMHRAKGLQFDKVVLYALGRSTRGPTRSLLSWLEIPHAGGLGMIVSPVGPRAELERDPLHRCIESVHNERDRLELDRLLYVACTRARRALHLIGHVALAADAADHAAPPAGSLLSRIWPALESEFARAFAAGKGVGSGRPAASPKLVAPVLRRFAVPWVSPAPPPLPAAREAEAETAQQPDIDYYWVGLAARHAGTIVHHWLRKFAGAALEPAAVGAGDLSPASRRMAQELGVPADQIDAVCERVERALRATLADDRGRWLISGPGHAELAITGIRDGRAASILIDRVRIDDGVHWIVDYKTGSHEGGDLQQFLDQETERYRAQLRKYKTLYGRLVDAPVRTALYFPLLSRFVEVQV